MEKLVNVYRGDTVESTHFGHVAVVNAQGELLYSVGDPLRKTYARSSVKPIQALPIIETGAANDNQLNNEALSLCCASHNGEEQHTELVRTMLTNAGLTEDHLQCGTHIPKCQHAYKKMIKENRDLSPRYNNCSGKHTGMLLTAKYMGETLEDYYLPEHPVQQRILQVISELSGVEKEEIQTGIDGCGVPVFQLPLDRLAFAFARMAKPDHLEENRRMSISRITTAMTEYPHMVAGRERFCTDFMSAGKGRFISKSGAEAVYCVGDQQTGTGIAVKIEDGNSRAVNLVVLEVLKQLELITEEQLQEVMQYAQPVLTNARDEEVGRLIPTFSLKKAVNA